MKIFITDETNINHDKEFDFFIYGGLIIDEKDILPLSKALLQIKSELNLERKRPIKWTNNKWKGQEPLDIEVHKNVKERMINLIADSNAKIVIYLSPSDFHHTKEYKAFKLYKKFNQEKYIRSQKYALNVVCYKFDQILLKENEFGLVFADNFMESINREISEFCEDLYPDGKSYKYEKIAMPLFQINNENSILHQYNDVVLGAIYYSLREMSFNFLPQLKSSFHCDDYGKINSNGINVFPKQQKTKEIEQQVLKLNKKFNRLLDQQKD